LEARSKCFEVLLSKCEKVIEDFFTNSQTYLNDNELLKKVEKAVYKVGLISLIGFNADESIIACDDKKLTDCVFIDILAGLNVRPSARLIRLIRALLVPFLPSVHDTDTNSLSTPNNIRAVAFVTIGQLCLLDDGDLLKETINILLHELKQNSDKSCSSIQSNVLLVLGDLCVKYTNLVDKELPIIATFIQAGYQSSVTGSSPAQFVADNDNKILLIVASHRFGI